MGEQAVDGSIDVAGAVTAIDAVPCPLVPDDTPDTFKPTVCGTASLRVLNDPHQGETVEAERPSGSAR